MTSKRKIHSVARDRSGLEDPSAEVARVSLDLKASQISLGEPKGEVREAVHSVIYLMSLRRCSGEKKEAEEPKHRLKDKT